MGFKFTAGEIQLEGAPKGQRPSFIDNRNFPIQYTQLSKWIHASSQSKHSPTHTSTPHFPTPIAQIIARSPDYKDRILTWHLNCCLIALYGISFKIIHLGYIFEGKTPQEESFNRRRMWLIHLLQSGEKLHGYRSKKKFHY